MTPAELLAMREDMDAQAEAANLAGVCVGKLVNMARAPRMWALTREGFAVQVVMAAAYQGATEARLVVIQRILMGDYPTYNAVTLEMAAQALTDEWGRWAVSVAEQVLAGATLEDLRQAEKARRGVGGVEKALTPGSGLCTPPPAPSPPVSSADSMPDS